MPRIVPSDEKLRAINLMLERNSDGSFKYGQRELEKETGLSRPFIRKLARQVGHQFPRNGIEVKGSLCMCTNCGGFFRRPPSKITRVKNTYCSEGCKVDHMRGSEHSNWQGGKSANTFSQWVKNQKEYKQWKEQVMARDGFKCAISGRTDNLDCHHIYLKSENPERAFDIDNGITVNEDVHREIHKLIHEGLGFEEAVEKIKQEYQNVTD